MLTAMNLAARDADAESGALTVLLIAAIVVLIVGVLEATGVTAKTGTRYGALVAGAVLLVLYFFLT